jgi:hypothetical protein
MIPSAVQCIFVDPIWPIESEAPERVQVAK